VINILSEPNVRTDFPKRLPQKLKAIREQLGMTPDQLAPFVGAKTGAEIEAYENDEDDLLSRCCLVTPRWREYPSKTSCTMIASCGSVSGGID
jgi:hypothetical protein